MSARCLFRDCSALALSCLLAFASCSISRNADGVYEGVAIGGDRYPGTTFIDHLRRYQANPDVKMMVVLGEVGGVEEYEICKAIDQKVLTKPIVAWCIGTCAKIFPYEVSFVVPLALRCSRFIEALCCVL